MKRVFAVLTALALLIGTAAFYAESAASVEFPSSFDLRSVDTDGDGVGDRCYVTPVRSQKPLGDCWAFGAIAASESSILGSLLEHDPEAYQTLNLSEKQVAYFAHTAISDPDHPQNGEGFYAVEVTDADSIYDVSAGIQAGSALAMGIGPVSESRDPVYEHHGKGKVIAQEKTEDGSLYDFSYSVDDDWTMEETYRFRRDYILTGVLSLPSPNSSPSGSQDDPEYLYNEAGTAAIKEQLLQKRAVAIAFHSDTSEPWLHDGEGDFMNVEHWAHYTWQRGAKFPPNHVVTIVGWDDDYPADNFLPGHQPPAGGAWLIKNSWGAGTNEFPDRGLATWGIPVDPEDPSKGGSGYFWLSYYDQSISYPAAYVYDYSLLGAEAGSGFDPSTVIEDQYDFLPATGLSESKREDEIRMANVFTAKEPEDLTAVSFQTESPDMTVSCAVYLLEDGYQSPEDGTRVASGEKTCKYAGIHMLSLPEKVPLAEGQAYSVVMTQKGADGSYSFILPTGLGKNSASVKQGFADRYAECVINPGESFLKVNGTWGDMADRKTVLSFWGLPEDDDQIAASGTELDNFVIKAYGIRKDTTIH